ncbi:unnamed protein product [Closterium sp. NIES-53]
MHEIRQAYEQHLQVDPHVFEALDVDPQVLESLDPNLGDVPLEHVGSIEGHADDTAGYAGADGAGDGAFGAAAPGAVSGIAVVSSASYSPGPSPSAATASEASQYSTSNWASKIVASMSSAAAAAPAGVVYDEGQARQGDADSSVLLESGFSAPPPKGGGRAKGKQRQGARGKAGGRGMGGEAGGVVGSSIAGVAGVGGAAAGAWAAVGGVVESVSRGVCVGLPGSVSEVRDAEAASLLISRPTTENGGGY